MSIFIYHILNIDHEYSESWYPNSWMFFLMENKKNEI